MSVRRPKLAKKENRSYFIWRFGKPPDGIVEVVSNLEGGELTTKFERYARIRVPYYIVWDPYCFLAKQTLHCFELNGTKYTPCDPWFPDLELGVTTWTGEYDGVSGIWLRWCDQQGKVLPTGMERAAAAEHRAALLAQKLRAAGIDPDA
jgi:Putative restriction endonuclease